MTTLKLAPSLVSNNEVQYTGKTYACIRCARGQKWYSKRRFKS